MLPKTYFGKFRCSSSNRALYRRLVAHSAADARQLEHLVASNPFDDFKFSPIRESQASRLSICVLKTFVLCLRAVRVQTTKLEIRDAAFRSELEVPIFE